MTINASSVRTSGKSIVKIFEGEHEGAKEEIERIER